MNKLIIVIAILFLVSAALNAALFVGKDEVLNTFGLRVTEPVPAVPPVSPISEPKDLQMKKFATEDEFKEYLEAGQGVSQAYGIAADFGVGGATKNLQAAPLAAPAPAVGMGGAEGAFAAPDRVSETNVQVKGIDEPDIVKTDGKEIYFSSQSGYYAKPMPLMETRPVTGGGVAEPSVMVSGGIMVPPYYQQRNTKVIRAFPPSELAEESGIDQSGDLLLNDGTLVIFSGNVIKGYNVSDPAVPKESWKMELENNSWIESSRLLDGKIYLVIRSGISYGRPCPLPLMNLGGAPISISCVEIYHPIVVAPTDVTYTALEIDPSNGKIGKKISFTGSSGSSVLYVSKNALYVSYVYPPDVFALFYDFFNEKGKDLVPQELLDRFGKLAGYDLSYNTKLSEFTYLMSGYFNSLGDDERLRVENELTNRGKDYFNEHVRNLEQTQIVKIDLKNFNVAAEGSIPGHLLNQFALDEYEGYLRAAVTISGSAVFIGRAESVNDVYVLDKDLKVAGSVKDLGVTERIYSARFVGPRGYLVTFRQTDPFYVLDLSDPSKPEMKGELKIPGFSSYLHPIGDSLILGVGQESSQVKLSLFDVSSAADPKEVAKYTLKEYWTQVASNHHAFLLDDKHKVFFIPAGSNGYVFSYDGNAITLKRAVSDLQAVRAIYLNDYMYVIGDRIIVLNENDWTEVNKLSFK